MIKTVLHIIILLTFFSCNNNPEKKKTQTKETNQFEEIDTIIKYRTNGTKEFEVLTKNGLKTGNKFFFDQNKNIIGFKHYELDTVNGYSLILNENTFQQNIYMKQIKEKEMELKLLFMKMVLFNHLELLIYTITVK